MSSQQNNSDHFVFKLVVVCLLLLIYGKGWSIHSEIRAVGDKIADAQKVQAPAQPQEEVKEKVDAPKASVTKGSSNRAPAPPPTYQKYVADLQQYARDVKAGENFMINDDTPLTIKEHPVTYKGTENGHVVIEHIVSGAGGPGKAWRKLVPLAYHPSPLYNVPEGEITGDITIEGETIRIVFANEKVCRYLVTKKSRIQP